MPLTLRHLPLAASVSLLSSPVSNNLFYHDGSNDRIFVFPYAYNVPASLLELAVGVQVALLDGEDLSPPPVAMCFGPSAMNRASMPEAAVNEDGNTSRTKDDIGAAPEPLQRLPVDSKPESSSV